MSEAEAYIVSYRGSRYAFSSTNALRYEFIDHIEDRPYMNTTTISGELRRLIDHYHTGWGRLFYAIEHLQHLAYKKSSYSAQIHVLHDAYSGNDALYQVYDAEDANAELYLCEDAMQFLGGSLSVRGADYLQGRDVQEGTRVYLLRKSPVSGWRLLELMVRAVGVFQHEGKEYELCLSDGMHLWFADRKDLGSTLFLLKGEGERARLGKEEG